MLSKLVDTRRAGIPSLGKRFVGETGLTTYFQRQVLQIRQGGSRVALRKVRSVLGRALFASCIPFALPVVLAVRVIRPFVLIRFGALDSCRIGHFAANTENYLCARDAGLQPIDAVDLFYQFKPIANRQLDRMWKRSGRFYVSPAVSVLDRANRLLPGSAPHVIVMPSDRDTSGLMSRFPPHLRFTEEEERKGRKALEAMCIDGDAPFICFHARDSAYLDAAIPLAWPSRWEYHDYRDSSIRNVIPAAEELTRRGYVAIRMGAIVKERLNSTNPKIVDYATNGHRTDFMDIYLGAKCRFFLGDTAGLWAIPAVFRHPVAVFNFVPLEHAPIARTTDLFIPKKVWLREEGRLMSFPETLASGVGRFLSTDQYVQRGIDLMENTPEEIAALATEMDDRLNGRWNANEEDEELQRQFWSLFQTSQLNPGRLNPVHMRRIGAEFLRQNRELLGLSTQTSDLASTRKHATPNRVRLGQG